MEVTCYNASREIDYAQGTIVKKPVLEYRIEPQPNGNNSAALVVVGLTIAFFLAALEIIIGTVWVIGHFGSSHY